MGAGRIRVYQAPCSEPGFGTCDAGFQTIFSRHGFAEFVLHKHPETDDWYLDPAKIR